MTLYESALKRSRPAMDELSHNDETGLTLIDKSYPVALPTILHDSDSYRYSIQEIYYITDLHIDIHIRNEYPNGASDEQVLAYIRDVANSLISEEIREKITQAKPPIILFGGDISGVFEIAELFYREFAAIWNRLEKDSVENPKGLRNVLAILGNNELWDFQTHDACVKAYAALLEELNILFLESRIAWLGGRRMPITEKINEDTGKYELRRLERDENPDSYDRQMIYSSNTIIVGGIGCADKNTELNADQRLYGRAVDETKERQLADHWREVFFQANEHAKELHSNLVVLSHMPPKDWIDPAEVPENCLIFHGHTHRNMSDSRDGNITILGDNQVGYTGSFQLMKARLYRPRNPFAADSDGFREISVEEYEEYYHYIDEQIPGAGIIKRQIDEYGAKLYAVKHCEYYGFFMTSRTGTYICNGGQIRKIRGAEDISYYNESFMDMVHTYIQMLSPLRAVQEALSRYIKSIGGTGKIHGMIVDIDFYNHAMINIDDGSIAFYYSPVLGEVERYPELRTLLHHQCPEMEMKYLEIHGQINEPKFLETDSLKAPGKQELQHVDLKDRPYAVSKKINALQRLFEKNVLRDWDEVELQNAFGQQIP